MSVRTLHTQGNVYITSKRIYIYEVQECRAQLRYVLCTHFLFSDDRREYASVAVFTKIISQKKNSCR